MKKTLPELKPALNQMPGYALLTLQGWEIPAASLDSSYEVCIQRNQDSRFLGADKKWTPTQTWHQVDATESQNEFVALTLGPNVVDPLVENPQMTYLLQARFGEELAQGVMRIREGVLSSHASGLTGEAVSRIAKPFETVAPVVTAVNTAPEVPPAVTPSVAAEPANQAKSSPAMIIAAIVLVLLLIAAYFAWRWYQNQQQVAVAPPTVATEAAAVTTPPTAEPPAATPAEPAVAPPAAPPAAPPPEPAPVAAVVAPPPPPAACSSEALAATKDDLSFIQACLRTTPDTEKVLAVIESAKTAKRCDVAHRLYAFKGQAGDVVIALAYAKEFDPKSFTAGCVTAADKNTALYWYDLVLARDANHAEAKERAEALRK
ncbi:MAG: hypothetical protein QE486_01455 [Burkholderiaceae bacterium]|jgi:hypothetical protein|nr:hypothetical protein [Burkholderiaceae bacterium]